MALIPLEEAQDYVLDSCQRLSTIRLSLWESLNHVLAQTVTSPEPVPPFSSTAMDGFAVRASDTQKAPVELRVVDTASAGHPSAAELEAGQAIRIMTGAPIPKGADAVVKVEDTNSPSDNLSNTRVVIEHPVRPGTHIRHVGESLLRDDEVFSAGTLIRPAHLGMLASLGINELEVYRLPKVAVLSSGDELVEIQDSVGPGQIRDSNRYLLQSSIHQCGLEVVDLGIVRDDKGLIAQAISLGIDRADAVVISGGVSMGDFDYVKVVLDELSAGNMRWMQVAIQPAKPLAFGLIKDKPVFGLPGNPVSSLVSFELFARPALLKMAGRSRIHRLHLQAIADERIIGHSDGKLHLLRAVIYQTLDSQLHLRLTGNQGSHLLKPLANANALALVPSGTDISPGERLEAMILDPEEIERVNG